MDASTSDLASGAWASLLDDPAKVLRNMAAGAADGAFGMPSPVPAAPAAPAGVPVNNPVANQSKVDAQPSAGAGILGWFKQNSRLVMVAGSVIAAIGVLVLLLRPRRK